MTNPPSTRIPEGFAFLKLLKCHQNSCADETTTNVAKFEKSAIRTIERIGTILSLLDRLASCYWGCGGGHHAIEHLVGRSVSHAAATIRLIYMGHYDEAWALTRNIAETGNLIWLFFLVPDEVDRWVTSSDSQRRSQFGPAKVRRKIEAAGSVVPHDKDSYSTMCEVGVHPNPTHPPHASHNAHGIPTLGGVYQELGFIDSLGKLGWAIATVGGPAAKMTRIDIEHENRIVDLVTSLVADLPTPTERGEVTDSSTALLSKTQWLDRNLRGKSESSMGVG